MSLKVVQCTFITYIKNSRLKVIYKATIVGTVSMAIFAFFGSLVGSATVAALLLIIGICNCGTDSVLIGAITAEMGNIDGLNAGAGVTSFVNGFSSTGGILEGPLLGILVSHFGWNSVLLTIVTSAMIAAFALVKAEIVGTKEGSKKHELLLNSIA